MYLSRDKHKREYHVQIIDLGVENLRDKTFISLLILNLITYGQKEIAITLISDLKKPII